MHIVRTFALLVSLMLPTVALSQAADELAAAKIAAIESVAAEIATKHGISKDAAIDYLKLALKAKNAAEQAKKDGYDPEAIAAELERSFVTAMVQGSPSRELRESEGEKGD